MEKSLPFVLEFILPLTLALDNPNHAVMEDIAKLESHRQLRDKKTEKDKLATGFRAIRFGLDEKPPVGLERDCFWVPASIRHEVKKDDTTGMTRYSFFVYGGVNVQARINQVAGTGPLSGNRINNRQLSRAANLRSQGFQAHHIISRSNPATRNHELLQRAGFNNINARANMIFLPKHESLHPTRSVHNGRHTQAAMDNVRNKMDDVLSYGRVQNWTPAQYKAALREMLSEYRQEFRAGNIALNVHQRPWAK